MADFRGQALGPYQLIKAVGSGGMATIYKAYQPGLDRVVAIKVLPEYLLNQAGFIDRFKIEAQAVARSIIHTSCRSTTTATPTICRIWS